MTLFGHEFEIQSTLAACLDGGPWMPPRFKNRSGRESCIDDSEGFLIAVEVGLGFAPKFLDFWTGVTNCVTFGREVRISRSKFWR